MKAIGFDLGGTKIASGVVDEKGVVYDYSSEFSDIKNGWPSVQKQILSRVEYLSEKHKVIPVVGISSAGPLDGSKGVLLDPTNFFLNSKKSWGSIPIIKSLEKKSRFKFILENDAAASVLAEHSVGAGRGTKNILLLTLGTGVGVAAVCNNELVRGGHLLHPEAGHLIINADDRTLRCGCGNYGCTESFLSANSFVKRIKLLWGNDNITNADIEEFAKRRNPKALTAFKEYGELLAQAIYNYFVLYYPDKIFIAGGFAKASPFYLPAAQAKLQELLARRSKTLKIKPTIKLAKLGRHIGVVGGAQLAFNSQKSLPKKKRSQSSK